MEQENRMTSTAAQPRRQDGVAPAGEAMPGSVPLQLSSQDLLRGHQAVAITHNGALYRLQTTRQGKLILTK